MRYKSESDCFGMPSTILKINMLYSNDEDSVVWRVGMTSKSHCTIENTFGQARWFFLFTVTNFTIGYY